MAKHAEFFRVGSSAGFATKYKSEGSGSSERWDAGVAVSEHSIPHRQGWISLNSASRDGFAVPIQVLPLSKLSSSERKNLFLQLRSELEQLRILQKKVEFYMTNAVAVSSSSDIVSCNNAQKGPPIGSKKKSAGNHGSEKKSIFLGHKAKGWNRGTSGRFEAVKQASAPSNSNATWMKHCENLLKKLMSHQFGWVFNEPVDIVKLKIPDYLTIIKHPMDLGTVKKKLSSRAYSSPLEFVAAVRLTFSNAMTYNPPGNDVHIMADTMRKSFEVRWKAIEKKLLVNISESVEEKSGLLEEIETVSKKRRLSPMQHEIMPEHPKRRMTDDEKNKLRSDLETLSVDLPENITEFLKEQSSNGTEAGDDEIEIDFDIFTDDTLFTLRKLLDELLQEKQKHSAKAEPCEIELPHNSGLSNSSMQLDRDTGHVDEEVDIGGKEPQVSTYHPVEIEKDTVSKRDEFINTGGPNDSSSSSDDESEDKQASSHVKENHSSRESVDGKETESFSGLDQLEARSLEIPISVESEAYQHRECTSSERRVHPVKHYRAAILKNRFADTILKAREKTLGDVEKGDPEKLRREREELEIQRRKEKARLQAEAEAAEEAQRHAEAEAAAKAKRKRELEREAARQALLMMEKTVEMNENSRFLEDLEMLAAVPTEQLHSSVEETSPDHSQDGLGSFKFGGSNALEQLGLYMKVDDDEEECEPVTAPSDSPNEECEPVTAPSDSPNKECEPVIVPSGPNDVEEGEID